MDRYYCSLMGRLKLQTSFKRLFTFCATSRGPLSMFKLLNEDEISTSNYSRNLLECFTADDPLIQLVITVSKSHISTYGDGGLSLPSYISSWFIHEESKGNENGALTSDIFELLFDKLSKYLYSKECVLQLPIEYDNLKELMWVVHSVVGSKPSCSNSFDVVMLSKLIVTAFLKSIPSENEDSKLGEIKLHKCEGTDPGNSAIYDGLLVSIIKHEISDSLVKAVKSNLFCNSNGQSSCVIFTCSLEESLIDELQTDLESEKSEDLICELLMMLGEKLVQNKINIVALQKGIHVKLKLFLERSGVMVLERLGTENVLLLTKLTGTKPSNFYSSEEMTNARLNIGYLSSIQLIEIGSSEKIFLLLSGGNCNIQTIVIANLMPYDSEQAMIAAKQSLETLKRLAKGKLCLPGAGCTEVGIICYLKNQVHAAETLQLLSRICSFWK